MPLSLHAPPKTILVVEDMTPFLRLAQTILEDAGFRVLTASGASSPGLKCVFEFASV
jgi:CheY-like chemotaxis protein